MKSKLSLVIPAYNEEKTIKELLEKVSNTQLPDDFEKEVIVINDASKDSTQEIVSELINKYPYLKLLRNEKNLGKSQSVRKGILESTGDYVVIQDADLEYEPEEIGTMLQKMLDKKLDVVYGNRFGKKNKVIYYQNYIGNKILSFISNLFTYPRIRVWIPDMEVCYKLVRGDVMREIAKTIESRSNFGFEPEVTAKLSRYKKQDRKHLRFIVEPITYRPRTIAEGKKMKAIKDGIKALKEILKFNLY